MITAQDIQEMTFEKKFNGYNMDQVDAFLDKMAAELTALAKENATLKEKMRVLTEKVSEYRETEGSMRLALKTVQDMSTKLTEETQAKADALLSQAREEAERITSAARNSLASEEAKLAKAKIGTQRFFDHMRTACERQIEFYQKLESMQFVGDDASSAVAPAESQPAPAAARPAVVSLSDTQKPSARDAEVEDTVKRIETSVEQVALQPEVAITVDTAIPEEEEEPTRLFTSEDSKKKRSFDDFRFDDDV